MKEEKESLKGLRIAAHVCRMLVEYRTLNNRIRNLDSFLKDHPDTEESHEQELQLAAMRLYAYHLCKRIRLHGIEDPLCEHLPADPDVIHKAYMAYPAIHQVSDGKELVKGPDDLNLDCRQAYLKGYCQAEEDWNELKEMRGDQKQVTPKFGVGYTVVCHKRGNKCFGQKKVVGAVYAQHGIYVLNDLSILPLESQDDWGVWEAPKGELAEFEEHLEKEPKKIEQKPWSEEDEKYVKDLADYFTGGLSLKYAEEDIADWFKSLKDRVQPQPKQEWSEDDVKMIEDAIYSINFESVTEGLRCRGIKYSCDMADTLTEKLHNWLKSLRPQNTWKPSEEMLDALGRAIPEFVKEISEDEMLLKELYQGLKYGRVLNKK